MCVWLDEVHVRLALVWVVAVATWRTHLGIELFRDPVVPLGVTDRVLNVIVPCRLIDGVSDGFVDVEHQLVECLTTRDRECLI